MRKYLLLLSGLVLLYGCIGNNRNLQQKLIDDKISAELKSGVLHDTVFLGLCLGDSLKAVNDDLQALLERKELTVNSSGQYEHDFIFNGPGNSKVKAQATLLERYYGDKLYQVVLRVKSDDPAISFPPVLELNLLDVFSKEYGNDYISSNTSVKEYNNYKDYSWVNGNRLIELKLSQDGVVVIFTDTRTKQFIDSARQAEKIPGQDPG